MARSVLALVACTVLFVSPVVWGQVSGSTNQPPGAGETHGPARFDIDAQPLAAALRAYSESTGIAVLFDDALVAGRTSPGVHGVVPSHDALRILLVGTGLTGHFSSMNAFTVTADDAFADDRARTGQADTDTAGNRLDAPSAALVQRAIERALCADAITRPGHYRLAMQLWIGADGVVDKVAALAASDDTRRDERVVATLRGVRMAPRLNRFSPVTVLLAPSTDRASARCGTAADEG